MNILTIATSQIGIKEINGEEDNPQILKYATDTGIGGISNDEIAWCSTFINWCAKEAGLPMSGKANARSWLAVGSGPLHPEPGDIVIFWRESIHSWKGHVGIFLGYSDDATRVFCLGGNQSDAVNIADYDVNKILGFRRIEEIQKLRIPKPTIKRGYKGITVSQLQIILRHLDVYHADIDGDFGPKTEAALKLFQANEALMVDGEYGNKSKNRIESLMQD
jgi:uncharacterized protein (TIGR02594 family)